MIPTESALQIAFHHYNIDFVLGMAIAIAAKKSCLHSLTLVGVITTCILAATWFSFGGKAGTWMHVLTYKALFFAILGGAVIASQNKISAPKLFLILGSASYSIYLLNRDVGYNLERIVRRLGAGEYLGSWPLFVAFVGICIVLGVALYLLFERHALKWIASLAPSRGDSSIADKN